MTANDWSTLHGDPDVSASLEADRHLKWSLGDSNSCPPACHAGALPTVPRPLPGVLVSTGRLYNGTPELSQGLFAVT